MKLGRRRLFEAAAALTIAFELDGCAPTANRALPARPLAAGPPFEPNAYLRVHASGAITLYATRLEMGQGIRTLLPVMLAEELDVDLAQVTIETAIPGPRFSGVRLHTGGSGSSREAFRKLRSAGAAAREMLTGAAAKTWRVDATTCTTERGRVLHPTTGRALGYGELVPLARTMPVPSAPTLKPVAAWTKLGKRQKRVNGHDIVTGKVRYGMDVRVPGMVFAAVMRTPTLGGRVKSVDDAAARAIPGVLGVHRVSAGIHPGVAVVAIDTWTALRARDALKVEWEASPIDGFDSERFLAELPNAFKGTLVEVRHEGDARAQIAAAPRRFEATYVYPFQAHASLETMNCTAHVRNGEVEVWAPTQTDVRSIEMAAKVAHCPKEKVTLHCELMGGGFGRRLYADFVGEAVELSVATKKPVQLVYSRADDMRSGYFQPATAQRFTAGLDARGRITGLVHDATASTLTIDELHEGKDIWHDPPKRGPVDYAADERPWGAFDNPYELASLRLDCADVTSPVPTGPWRAVEYPSTVFARESFLDELAHLAKVDPIAYRLELLPPGIKAIGPYKIDRARLARVLEIARTRSGWNTPLAPREGQVVGRGVAANVYSGNSYVAMVVEVAVAKDLSKLRVERALTVVDCGAALNPLGIEGQTESGIAWGLSATLLGKMNFVNGRPVQSGYGDFRVLRIDAMPRVETVIVENPDGMPAGYGEHPVPLVAPAVANAVYAACGKRVRALPITAEALRRA